ncbi:MAG TPA: ornithine carbamoyltransferase [bacterium]|nr:ornithine carbamoyltransferase [bacterium]HPJ71942.1 ornithine carbamoyltransferase [bacterium]HPQ67219.1 ornithine carbamoyltransferase [bacterium]
MGNLKYKDFICTQEWAKEDLDRVLKLAFEMKQDRFGSKYLDILFRKQFFMFFYNPSVRTRQSFEAAATELGAHAQFLEPKSMRLKTAKSAGETVEDAAQVMDRYAAGLGIRILEDKIAAYGQGDDLLREYAKWAKMPVISMAHDKFHPCQGLADVMGWIEWLAPQGKLATGTLATTFDPDALKGKKLLLTWAQGALCRSLCSVQEAILIGSRYGMDVTVAHPEGYDLDPEVVAAAKMNCETNDRTFEVTHDSAAGYDGAHVVYSRNWMSPEAYRDGELRKQEEIEKALGYRGWTCTAEKMAATDNGIYTHPMPIDRGSEVTDEVASGPNSCIYDVAENRLHGQKAVMAATMAGFLD